MSRRIQILPDSVANQIAAGEAVERPASVVKELVENALDAKATRVEIAIEKGGKRRIRVSDDGVGMGREDALLCLDRHATSKIENASDLAGVRTFGFRGEAMPSIAAVSRMTIETSDGGDDGGTKVTVSGGQIGKVSDLARRRGTTVEVRNLFHNAPVRARFLKAVSAETRAVSDAVTQLALANPTVGFTLTSDERTLLDLPPAADAAERIIQLWGGEDGSALITTRHEEDGVVVRGLVQRPDRAKPGAGRRYLFVNGRPFRERAILKAADRAYRTTVADGVRPWFFLYLDAAGDGVDVNVHPTKAEVRFRDPSLVERVVEKAVRDTLDGDESAATFDTQLATPTLAVREAPDTVGTGEPDDQIALFVSASDESPVEGREVTVSTEAPRPRLWQVMNTYVLAETRDGILIIDQHSAHERILFQRLMDAYEIGGQEGQRLLFPLTVRLTPLEVECVLDLKGLLARSGFEVEGFGGDTVIVHSVPNPHRYFDADRAFREMVGELTHGSELVRSAKNQHERIAMTFACKGSIKAGQRLSQSEMEELFDQLFATELPNHDVHGRPTIVRLSASELERKFGRS